MKRLLALMVLGTCGIALAQSDAPSFEEVDANQDGQLSRQELSTIEGLDFMSTDANQDGSVDRQEYMAVTGSGE
jgi:Ca2+-binding EF-hand superfamily protein